MVHKRPNSVTGSAIVVAALAFAMSACGETPAWTQWGGPQRNFTVNSTGLADKWPDGGPKKLWIRALGEGYSGILAAGGKLFTMYRDGEMTSSWP